MPVTCDNCGATLSVGAGASLRSVTREPLAGEGAEFLIVESAGAGDVLVHSCAIAAAAKTR